MTAPKLSPNGVRRRGAPSSATTVPFLPLATFVAALIVVLILFYNPSARSPPVADPHETMKTTLSSAASHPGLTNKSSSSSRSGSAGDGGASSPSSSTTAVENGNASPAKGGGTAPMSPPGVAQDHHSKEQALANLRQLEFETILSPIVVVPPDYIPPVPYRRDALTLLHDLSTPHGRAFDFVVRKDQRKIALDDVADGDGMVGDVTERRRKERQIVQRFVVTLLFYSTGGSAEDGDGGNDEPRSSTWTHGAAHFLSPLHECHWSKSLPYSDLLYGIVKHRSHKVGVTSCHSQSLTVTEIRLNDNGLTGTLPAELRELTELEVLDVRGNRLSGPIPREWGLGQGGDEGWATSMKYLGLDGNGLTGEVPSELGSLTNLEHLYLNFNDFSGAIPSEVCRLRDDGNVDPIDDDDNLNLLRRRRRRLRQGQRGTGTDAAAGSTSRRRTTTERRRRRHEGILNGKLLTDLWSDCGAAWPPLECRCCTVCCDGMGECDEVGDDGSVVGMTEEDDGVGGLDDDGFEDDDFQGERGGVDDDGDEHEGFDDDDDEEGEERP